jgi:hypothetical protein
MGVREIQKQLEFSSPALASYHLDKLESLQLVEKTVKGYVLIKEVKIGVLAQMVKFGGLLLPRYTFYVSLVSIMLVFYLVSGYFTNTLNFDINGISAVLIGLTALLIMIYEYVRIWKHKIV